MPKPGFERREIPKKLSAPHSKKKPHDSEGGNPADIEKATAQSCAHEQGDGNGHRDGEDTPRTFCQRLHHHQRQYCEQNDHDGEHADQCECAHPRPNLFLHHLPERFSAPPHRGEQHNHVVYAAPKGRPDQDPKRAR